ncbi:MAG: transcriptional regulator [Bacillota bacterium]
MVTDSQIIKAIRELSQRGYPPTVREVGSRVGLRSSNTIYSRLARLRDQGLVHWQPTQSRTLRVIGGDL